MYLESFPRGRPRQNILYHHKKHVVGQVPELSDIMIPSGFTHSFSEQNFVVFFHFFCIYSAFGGVSNLVLTQYFSILFVSLQGPDVPGPGDSD